MALRASPARADEVDDLMLARDAYLSGEFDRAAASLRELADRPGETARMQAVRPTARRLLAASLFALRRVPDARDVIATILRDDPAARLEPTQFEAPFVRLFNEVAREMQPELDEIAATRRANDLQRSLARDDRRRLALAFLGSAERVETVPRWQMFVPFGVGQFANDQRAVGWTFLALESLALVGTVVSFAVDQSVQSDLAPAGSFRADVSLDMQRASIASAMRYLNWTSAIALGSLVVAGVLQANVAYAPQRVTRVPRPLPPALQGLEIGMIPGGASGGMRLTF